MRAVGDEDVDFMVLVNDTRPFMRIEFNQGPVVAPCTAADTTAAISPAGMVTSDCGQSAAALRVSSSVGSAVLYEWQFAPAGSSRWQALPGGGTYQHIRPPNPAVTGFGLCRGSAWPYRPPPSCG